MTTKYNYDKEILQRIRHFLKNIKGCKHNTNLGKCSTLKDSKPHFERIFNYNSNSPKEINKAFSFIFLVFTSFS